MGQHLQPLSLGFRIEAGAADGPGPRADSCGAGLVLQTGFVLQTGLGVRFRGLEAL